MIAQARMKVRSGNVRFVVADIALPWPCRDRSFDLICCNLVLEHVRDLSVFFTEAARVLADSGRLFVSELHPFRQYQGTRARFRRGEETIGIPAFVHHLSEFAGAAGGSGLALLALNEWWHEEDERDGKPPRLASFMFEKPAASERRS
jgi:SAM-dependent methyltransferase